MNDIFYFIQNAYICNFSDENSLYSINTSIELGKKTLYAEAEQNR